jgi:hypothetical protein
MKEEKPNKSLIRLANISVIVGLFLWMVAIYGFVQYQSHFETSSFDYITQALSRLKYQFMDVFAGLVIIIQAYVINNVELKRVDRINEPWNVKPPTY